LGRMNLQNSGGCRRENAHVRHRPRRRTIQYSEASTMEVRARGVLDTRRSLSSGAHSRDPVAGMTAVGGASSSPYCEGRLRRSNPALPLRLLDCFAGARNDGFART
jgi:hypothetical protein